MISILARCHHLPSFLAPSHVCWWSCTRPQLRWVSHMLLVLHLIFFFCIFSLFVISTFIPNFFFFSGKHYKAPLLLYIESVAFYFFFNWSFCGNTLERCVFSGFLLGLFAWCRRSCLQHSHHSVHHLCLRHSFCLLTLCDDRLKRFELILIKHWQRCREGSELLGQFALNWLLCTYHKSGNDLCANFFLFIFFLDTH